MPYKPITIDRDNLSIMGVQFPDLETLDSAADAIGTNMFEGYEPTPQGIAIIRDYLLDKITLDDVIGLVQQPIPMNPGTCGSFGFGLLNKSRKMLCILL
jgi:putative transcriptional regulator